MTMLEKMGSAVLDSPIVGDATLRDVFYELTANLRPDVDVYDPETGVMLNKIGIVIARAVLDAMREPSEGMVDAGARTGHRDDFISRAENIYVAMIDAVRNGQ